MKVLSDTESLKWIISEWNVFLIMLMAHVCAQITPHFCVQVSGGEVWTAHLAFSWGHSTPSTSSLWPMAAILLCFLVCLLQLGRWLRSRSWEMETGFLCLQSRLRPSFTLSLWPFSFLWPLHGRPPAPDPWCLLAGHSACLDHAGRVRGAGRAPLPP